MGNARRCFTNRHVDDSVDDTLRDELLGNSLDHFPYFLRDLWYGDVDNLLHGTLMTALLWDQSHNVFRNVLDRHLRFAVWAQPPKITALACQCTGPVGYPLFSVPLNHRQQNTPASLKPTNLRESVWKELYMELIRPRCRKGKPLQFRAQIYSYASINENTRCNRSSG